MENWSPFFSAEKSTDENFLSKASVASLVDQFETSKTTFYNDQPRNFFFKKTLFTKRDVGDFISPSSDDILCPLSDFGTHDTIFYI